MLQGNECAVEAQAIVQYRERPAIIARIKKSERRAAVNEMWLFLMSGEGMIIQKTDFKSFQDARAAQRFLEQNLRVTPSASALFDPLEVYCDVARRMTENGLICVGHGELPKGPSSGTPTNKFCIAVWRDKKDVYVGYELGRNLIYDIREVGE